MFSRTFDERLTTNSFAIARAKVSGGSVTGNGLFGVLSTGDGANSQDCTQPGSVSLRDVDASGNAIDAACGTTEACGDIGACETPRLKDTICDTSYVTGSGIPGGSWSVCASD